MRYRDNFNPTISDVDVFDEIYREKENIGYHNLVFQDTVSFKEYVKTIK